MSSLDLSFVDEAVAQNRARTGAVVPILQAIQNHYHYLPEEALRRVCELTEITPAAITGVATFYTQFRHRPVGRHRIQVCRGTACHVKGADLVHDALAHQLGLKSGEDTDAAGRIHARARRLLGMLHAGAGGPDRRRDVRQADTAECASRAAGFCIAGTRSAASTPVARRTATIWARSVSGSVRAAWLRGAVTSSMRR